MKKFKSSTIFKLALFLIVFIAAEKFAKSQTKGFRLAKTQMDSIYPEAGPPPELLLNQPFYFLGCGQQCYAFVGKDQKTVLKLFKHFDKGVNSALLRKLPKTEWTSKILRKREKRLKKAFSSTLIAYRHFPEETGLLYLNLNPQNCNLPQIELYDNIGVRHSLDLKKTPFLLQKKGELIFSYLEKHPEETPAIVDSFLALIAKQIQVGVGNSDRHIARNFGVCEGRVIEIDTGSFLENGSIEKEDFLRLTRELNEWIEKKFPEL